MSCTLETLAACFSLAGMYVDAGVKVYDHPVFAEKTIELNHYYAGQDYFLSGTDVTEKHIANPYGYLAIGYTFGGPAFTFNLRGEHNSSIDTGSDRGLNSLSFGFTWRPFAR